MATIEVGTRLPPWRIEVDPGQMKTMAALLNDPNPIHWDTAAVRALGLGERPVNQGPTNVGYIVNMLLDWAGGDPAAIRRVNVRFRGNVFAGDRVEAGGEVIDTQDVDRHTVATCEVWLDRADGQRLVAGTAEVTFRT